MLYLVSVSNQQEADNAIQAMNEQELVRADF